MDNNDFDYGEIPEIDDTPSKPSMGERISQGARDYRDYKNSRIPEMPQRNNGNTNPNLMGGTGRTGMSSNIGGIPNKNVGLGARTGGNPNDSKRIQNALNRGRTPMNNPLNNKGANSSKGENPSPSGGLGKKDDDSLNKNKGLNNDDGLNKNSSNSSEPNESDNTDQNNSESKPKGSLLKDALASKLGLGSKDGKDEPIIGDIKGSIKRKILIAVIPIIGNFLLWTIIFIVAFFIFLMPIFYLNEMWQGIKNGIANIEHRFLQIIDFEEGWEETSQEFREKLYEGSSSEYSRWNKLNNIASDSEPYPVTLLVSTIYSLKTSDSSHAGLNYQYQDDTGEYKKTDDITNDNSSKKEAAFYSWGKTWLGTFNIFTLDLHFDSLSALGDMANLDYTKSIGQGLSGHIVNYKIGEYTKKCLTDGFDPNADNSESLIAILASEISNWANLIDINVDSIIKQIYNYLKNKDKFSTLGLNYTDATKLDGYYDAFNSKPLDRIWRIFENEDSVKFEDLPDAGALCIWIPRMKAYIDTKQYENYVKNVFIPATYFLCNECDYRIRYQALRDKMIEEHPFGGNDLTFSPEVEKERAYFDHIASTIYQNIWDTKDTYRDLFEDLNLNGSDSTSKYKSCNGYTTGDGSTMDNVKVKLLECARNYNDAKVVANLDFDTYVAGVVYAEMGYSSSMSAGALQAQAIAARSFAIARTMPNLGYDDETNTITIRGCEYDQVYCDYKKGCYRRNLNSGDSTFGYYEQATSADPDSNKWKQALSGDDLKRFETIMAEVSGVVALDSDGEVIETGYNSTKTNGFTSMGNNGYSYNQIMTESYDNMSTLSDDCGSVGDFVNWKQYEGPWESQIINPNAETPKTIHQVGCALTSTAIIIAKSGTKITIDPFNPGTFAEAMNNAGGFSGNDISWNHVSSSGIAPNFHYVDQVSLTGSKSNKIAQLLEYEKQGYYMVIAVKNYGHWVAFDTISGNTVYMMDPASTRTDLFTYSESGVVGVVLYRKDD